MSNRYFLNGQKDSDKTTVTPDGDREETNKQDDINQGGGESED